MMRKITLTSVFIFILLEAMCLHAFSNSTSDPCRSRIPKTLAHLLAGKFPEYRLPTLDDHLPEDIAHHQKYGGDGCLSVASGDFDGDKIQDIAVILTNNEKTKVILIAALKRKDRWEISQLPTWCESIVRCYVQVLQPGAYERSQSLHDPIVEPNERQHLTSKNAGILSGTIESTGVAYFYSNRKWLYVWVMD